MLFDVVVVVVNDKGIEFVFVCECCLCCWWLMTDDNDDDGGGGCVFSVGLSGDSGEFESCILYAKININDICSLDSSGDKSNEIVSSLPQANRMLSEVFFFLINFPLWNINAFI